MNRSIIALVVLLMLPMFSMAQDKSNKSIKRKYADKNFDNYAYAKAIAPYKELYKKGDITLIERIAQCYRNIGEIDSAEIWYGRLVSSTTRTPEDIYYYSELLKSNGKYTDADKWLKEYQKLKNDDTRPNRKLDDPKYLETLSKDPGRFSIEHLPINSEEADFGAIFWGNKVVFSSSRKGVKAVRRQYNWSQHPFLDLYVANKADDGFLFNPTHIRDELKTNYHEGPVSFSADGKTMFFTRNEYHKGKDEVDGINHLEIYMSKYDNGKWGNETVFPYNDLKYSNGHPSLSKDGKTLYFISDMPGGKGGTDIYKSELGHDNKWGKPQNLGSDINTEGNEMFPFIHKDGLLFFASNGHKGLGGLDIYMVELEKGKKPTNLATPINTSRDDFGFVIDDMLKYGYISSNRKGGTGDDDIYAIEMLKPFKELYYVKGTVIEKGSNELIPGASVDLRDKDGKIVSQTIADSNGTFSFEIEPDKQYNLTGNKKDFFEDNKPFSSINMNDDNTIEQDLKLEKDPGLSLYCLITDKATGQPLQEVHLTILDNMTGKELTNMKTPSTGDWKKPLPDKRIGERVSYNLKLEKEGYLGKVITFNHEIKQAGIINIHELLDITMDKVEVGTDIGKLINIQPIYFDYKKFDIRPDAAIELDKIVKVMAENPGIVIELGSHTDCRGSKAYNVKLSDKRAKSSAAYIQKRIDDPKRIYGKGYGESQIINGCECEGKVKSDCSDEQHQDNRRTEFKIVKM